MNKRFLIITCTLFIVAIFTWLLSNNAPSQPKSLYAKQLPIFINNWVGKDSEVDDKTLEILETDDVLMREYIKEGEPPVQLCIVYAKDNRKVAHPPEVCYKGGGWSLEEKKPIIFSTKSDEFLSTTDLMPGFKVIKLVLEKGNQRQLILYWYKCNKEYTSNYYKQQINIVKSEIINGNSTSGLIRISTPIIDKDEDVAIKRAQIFTLNILPLITKYLP